EILMHGVAVALVTAHLLGGSSPWVSKSTAVTVAIVQSVNALGALAARPYQQRVEAQRRRKARPDDELAASPVATESLLTIAARCRPSARGVAALQFAGGGCVIFALARGLKLSGALTKPQHAVLPALVLALGTRLLLRALAGGRKPEQESAGELEPEHADDEDECSDPAEDPYRPSFWEDLTEQESAEGPPSSEQTSADVYLKCVLGM
ncbi:unnamed protein product, partial [Prorocentrum cordatum]